MKIIRLPILLASLLITSINSSAQQPQKHPRIGFLTGTSVSVAAARTQAFRQGLRDLGYEEGKNIVIEWKSWEGKQELQRPLAADLAKQMVDAIVAVGAGDIRVAKETTATIPIVMVTPDDPVGSGFIASMARPGGNITGLATPRTQLSGKQLQVLKEILPKLARVAVFASPARNTAPFHEALDRAAGPLGVKLQYLEVRGVKDIESAFQAAVKERAEAALLLVSGPVLNPHRKEVAELAVKSRLPATYPDAENVEAGGLMSYGVSFPDLYRRAAGYVDKILKGAKPADLPVEQPTKFEFVINLQAANQIGLTVPPDVLARADKVIR